MADAVKTCWQDMDEEAAEELGGREPHDLLPRVAIDAVILVLERDAGAVAGKQAAVGDGDAVGIARQIGQHGLRAAEGVFAVRPPIRPRAMASDIPRRHRGPRGWRARQRIAGARRHGWRRAFPETASGTSCESTRTGRKKPGRQDIHLWPSKEMPPLGTLMWTCGWWVSADPQVCSTKVTPIRAPRCLGSAAIVIIVSAEALNRRS